MAGIDDISRLQGIGSTIAISGGVIYSRVKANLEERKRVSETDWNDLYLKKKLTLTKFHFSVK